MSVAHETPVRQRLQITFGKAGALKYTGGMDIAKVWERVLRRAQLPLYYTQGFNTRPRLQLAATLPMGVTSDCEIIDVALRERMPTLDDLGPRLEAVSPDGLRVHAIDSVPVNSPPLQTLVRSATYRITFIDGPPADLDQRVESLLAQERIIKKIQSKRRTSYVDLRPLVLGLHVEDDGLTAHLGAGERGNLRPDEILTQMDLDDHPARMHRAALHLEEYAHHTALTSHERDDLNDEERPS